MRIKQQNADWRLVYETFLQSEAWRIKRARILKRCNHMCEACNTARAAQAHHTVYPQPCTMETLTHQPDWQLRGVCDACHQHIHRK